MNALNADRMTPGGAEAAAKVVHSLPPELQSVVQTLCDTFAELDLRIETTMAAAGNDLVAALPELQGHDDGLHQLVTVLTRNLRSAAGSAKAEPILFHLKFQDEGDLTQQLMNNLDAMGEQA